jgi:hypothetical protein
LFHAEKLALRRVRPLGINWLYLCGNCLGAPWPGFR